MFRAWQSYAPTYRAREMRTLAGWIAAGQSAAVVGLAGSGKSNLLGFLCHRPDALRAYLPPHTGEIALASVDLNNLPSHSLATFYRVVLRSFHEARERLAPPLQTAVAALYLENRAARDPFLAQSALRELLLQFQAREMRVVLVIDRFEKAAHPAMLDALRGLRDSFKETLVYIVGMRQRMVYLFDPAALGEMYEILDTHICWVGPMEEDDARRLIADEIGAAAALPDGAALGRLLALTGGYPALLKAACHWWLAAEESGQCPPLAEWGAALLRERAVQSRLGEIWASLTQEEQQALAEGRVAAGMERHAWLRHVELFTAYAAAPERRGAGRIWRDETSGEFYRGRLRLGDLAPLERAILEFLIRRPYVRHTKTDLIVGAWPADLRRQGVADESLYQAIRELREKLEPHPERPCYIVTWRGRPEGGYQFFPEGRPDGAA